jgi:hypothetical protein
MLFKISNGMTKREFIAKINAAKNDMIAYHFNAESLKILENILLKKEFSKLEKYKIVMTQNAQCTEGSEIPASLKCEKIPLQRRQTT